MKIKRLFWSIILPICFLLSCSETPAPTAVEILSNSNKTWKISYLAINKSPVSAALYADVRYQFNANGSTPTTYSAKGVKTGGISTTGDKPDYFSPTSSGNWNILAGGILIFNPNTAQESEVSFVEIPKSGDKTVKIQWTIPEELDKLIPLCVMHLERID